MERISRGALNFRTHSSCLHAEGPLAQDPPAYATQIRLILSGKLVEPNKCLKGRLREAALVLPG
eukprot:1160562-Pelagomonas_calceolata.AAC.5